MPRTIPAALLDLGAKDLLQRITATTGDAPAAVAARVGLNPSSAYRINNGTSQEQVWRKLARLAVEVGAV